MCSRLLALQCNLFIIVCPIICVSCHEMLYIAFATSNDIFSCNYDTYSIFSLEIFIDDCCSCPLCQQNEGKKCSIVIIIVIKIIMIHS